MVKHKLKDKTQTEIAVVPVAGKAAVPKRHSAAPGIAEPTTTPQTTGRTGSSSGRIGLSTAAIVAIPVAAPLIYITTHIVYAQLVGLLGTYGMSFAPAIVIVPRHVTYRIAATIFVACTFVATTGGIFPFRLSGQTKGFARQLIQFGKKRLAVVPTDSFHR